MPPPASGVSGGGYYATARYSYILLLVLEHISNLFQFSDGFTKYQDFQANGWYSEGIKYNVKYCEV